MSACPMCAGTDSARECAQGQCRWQWEQEQAEQHAAWEREEQARYEAEMQAQWEAEQAAQQGGEA